ncbi:hypothetical protein PIB30_042801 [Stylosanthes scabra]|uniref:Peptidase A1 domain-containing protein n=1 Tax=Stylosanthes scabra TaxID=79078 RepID=A0ABU6SF86_9FABA|nr:hypothetical protein [Stylosanthes scabra]
MSKLKSSSSPPPSSILLVPLLIFFLPLLLPTFSTSRKIPDENHVIRINLHHIDSGKNLTKLERVQHGMIRAESRLERLNAMVSQKPSQFSESEGLDSKSESNSSPIESPIHAGNGEYLMELAIGTPPESYPAVLDTGSDLIWTQCKPCSKCYKQPTPIFDPKKSSSYSKLSCGSNLCSALSSTSCTDDDGSCQYMYTYGDYSVTQGILGAETFTFGTSKVKNIGFGCGEDNEGGGFEQSSGLVGLGRGPLSLVSQLKEPIFSYCLTTMENAKASVLLIGSSPKVKNSKGAITIPLLTNPSQPSFYYLDLQGISVGGTELSIEKSTFDIGEDGSGGLIIDSGTTITYIEENAFDALKKEFVSQINLPVDNSGSTGLDVCFNLPSNSGRIEVPKLVFHFRGGDLELPPENYMIADSNLGVACLAMGSSSGMSIFGNIQQQNLMVIHDLQRETMTFVPTQCDHI